MGSKCSALGGGDPFETINVYIITLKTSKKVCKKRMCAQILGKPLGKMSRLTPTNKLLKKHINIKLYVNFYVKFKFISKFSEKTVNFHYQCKSCYSISLSNYIIGIVTEVASKLRP